MFKTLGLILAITVAVVLTIAVCLVGLALLYVGLWMLWSGFRRLLFPARDAPIRANQTLLRDAPHFHRFQQGYTSEPVLSVAALPDKPGLTSTSRDKTLRVWDGEWNNETTTPLPFYPGPLIVGDHEDNGLRVAVGALKSSSSDENTPHVLVWEPMASSPDLSPTFEIVVPGLRVVHALAWDDAAETLRVFAGVFDPSRPTLPNRDANEPNGAKLLEWELRATNGFGHVPPPHSLPLPPELDRLSPWEFADGKAFTLSANGLYFACRTEYADPQTSSGGFGVGVWEVDAGAWRHRFGGREAYPHDLCAVSRSGDIVYSIRAATTATAGRNGTTVCTFGILKPRRPKGKKKPRRLQAWAAAETWCSTTTKP